MGFLKSFLREFANAKIGAPLDGATRFVILRKYVLYVLEFRPRRTAITLLEDKVPDTRFNINHSRITGYLEGFLNHNKGELGCSEDILMSMLRKCKSKIEPSIEEWECFDAFLLQVQDNVDLSKVKLN